MRNEDYAVETDIKGLKQECEANVLKQVKMSLSE